MVPGEPADKNSYRGDLGGQIGVLRCIHCLEYIMGSSPLVANLCDNVIALR